MNRLSSPIDLRRISRPFALGVFLLLAPPAAIGQEGGSIDSPANQDVWIVVGFDGSCPHEPAGVKREGSRRFRIFPSWRPSPGIDEEAVGRSTRLGFKVLNSGKDVQPVELWLDWQYHDAPPKARPNFASVDQYMSYRDFVVVRWPNSEHWQTVMVDVDDSVGYLRLDVPPGETEIHWHPPYNYAQSEQFAVLVD